MKRKASIYWALILVACSLFMCSCLHKQATTGKSTSALAPTTTQIPTTEAPTEPPFSLDEFVTSNSRQLFDMSDKFKVQGKTIESVAFLDNNRIAAIYTDRVVGKLEVRTLSLENGDFKLLIEWPFEIEDEGFVSIAIRSVNPLIITDDMTSTVFIYDEATNTSTVIAEDDYHQRAYGPHGIYSLSSDCKEVQYYDRTGLPQAVYAVDPSLHISINGVMDITADDRYLFCYGTSSYTLDQEYFVIDLQAQKLVAQFDSYSMMSLRDANCVYRIEYDEEDITIKRFKYPNATEYDSYTIDCNSSQVSASVFNNSINLIHSPDSQMIFERWDMDSARLQNRLTVDFDDSISFLASDYYAYSPSMEYYIFLCSNYTPVEGIGDYFDIAYDKVYIADLSRATEVDTEEQLQTSTHSLLYSDYSVPLAHQYPDFDAKIKEIEDKYGVLTIIGTNVKTDYNDYLAEICEDSSLISAALQLIDETLSSYPDGFFEYMKSGGYLSGINLFLVGDISPNSDSSISNAVAFANTYGNYQIFVLDLNYNYDLKRTLYHEISHAILSRIHYDEAQDDTIYFNEGYWETLNPDGFEYYGSYLDENGNGYDSTGSDEYTGTAYWASNDLNSVYFVDSYSKTFLTEDLARLLEYSMPFSYYADYMSSPKIQAKLKYYCKVISEVWQMDFNIVH